MLALAAAAGVTGATSAVSPGGASPDPLISDLLAHVDMAALSGYVAGLSGESHVTIGGQPYTFETRHSDTAGAVKATQYLHERYAALGLDVAYHEYLHEGHVWRNVVATLPGEDPTGGIYVVCAHVDSIAPRQEDAPGADDNASGVAAVLLAAEILSQYEFEHTLRFVNFTGEEQGLLGSAAYADEARAKGDQIAGVINLDMIGWDSTGGPDFDLHAGTDPASISLAQTFSETVAAYGLDLLPEILTDEATASSDHGSFWDNGYPAVLAIEDYHPGRKDFNPYYHTSDDLLVHLNLEYFTTFTRAMLATVAALAEPVTAPLPTPTPTASPTPTDTPQYHIILPYIEVADTSGR